MYMSHYTSLHHLIRQIIYEYFSHYLQSALLSTLSARAKSNTCAATKAYSDVKSDCRLGSWAKVRRVEIIFSSNAAEIHSPAECARAVLRRRRPASLSILVAWIVAISCRPRLLRMISNPL